MGVRRPPGHPLRLRPLQAEVWLGCRGDSGLGSSAGISRQHRTAFPQTGESRVEVRTTPLGAESPTREPRVQSGTGHPGCSRPGQLAWGLCTHSLRPCKGRRLPKPSPWGWPGWASPPSFPCVNFTIGKSLGVCPPPSPDFLGAGSRVAGARGRQWGGCLSIRRPLPLSLRLRRGGVEEAGLTVPGHWPLGTGSMRTLDPWGRQNGGRVGVDDGAPSPGVL